MLRNHARVLLGLLALAVWLSSSAAAGWDLDRHSIPLEEIPVGEMMAEIFTTAYRHRVYLPGDLALLARTIITLEGTGRAEKVARGVVDQRIDRSESGAQFLAVGVDGALCQVDLRRQCERATVIALFGDHEVVDELVDRNALASHDHIRCVESGQIEVLLDETESGAGSVAQSINGASYLRL